MKNLRGCLALLSFVLLVACGGAAADPFTAPGSLASAGASGAGVVAQAGTMGVLGREEMGGADASGGAPAAQGGSAGSGVAGSSAGMPSSSGSGGASAGASSSAGMGGTVASAGGAAGAPAGGSGGAAADQPKRITVIGVFGGQNASGSTSALPANGMYFWPDSRISEWTEYEDGAPLGPTAASEDSTLVTSGAELELGSDAHVSMPDAGVVAIVKFCRTKTLVSDWTADASVLPWFADYIGVVQEAATALGAKYPNAQIKIAHVVITGEYDAQTVAQVDPVALAATIRALKTKLTTAFPGSFLVATEPNLALSSWWPENAQVRTAFEAVTDDNFFLVNTDAIPPANASAHDPAFDAGQELNVGSRIEYGVEHLIETFWGAPPP